MFTPTSKWVPPSNLELGSMRARVSGRSYKKNQNKVQSIYLCPLLCIKKKPLAYL